MLVVIDGPGILERMWFGGQIALVGMFAVFGGLLAIYGVMALIPWLLRRRQLASAAAAGEPPTPELTAEVAHAIALALYMDLRILDEDQAQEITVKKLTQPFSPWVHSARDITLNEKAMIFMRRGQR